VGQSHRRHDDDDDEDEGMMLPEAVTQDEVDAPNEDGEAAPGPRLTGHDMLEQGRRHSESQRAASKFTISWARATPAATAAAIAALGVPDARPHSRSGSVSSEARRGSAQQRVASSPRHTPGNMLNTPGGAFTTASDETSITGLRTDSMMVMGTPRPLHSVAGLLPDNDRRTSAPMDSVFGGSQFSRLLQMRQTNPGANAALMVRSSPNDMQSGSVDLDQRSASFASNVIALQGGASLIVTPPTMLASPSTGHAPTPSSSNSRAESMSSSSHAQSQPCVSVLGTSTSLFSTQLITSQFHFAHSLMNRDGYKKRREIVLAYMKPTTLIRIRSWLDTSDHGEHPALGPLTNPQNADIALRRERKRNHHNLTFLPPQPYPMLLHQVDPYIPEEQLRQFSLRTSSRSNLIASFDQNAQVDGQQVASPRAFHSGGNGGRRYSQTPLVVATTLIHQQQPQQ
jgi:hypothetical protein